jgi:P-type Mg2+ transporter
MPFLFSSLFRRSPAVTPVVPLSLQVIEEAETELGALLTKLDTRRKGLTKVQVRQRLKKFGYNEWIVDRPHSWFQHLLQSFHSPFVYLLVGLAIVSLFIGDTRAALVLLGMVLLSGILRFVQEYRSNRAAEKLRAMVGVTATVSRYDELLYRERQKTVNICNLVPGDIVHLSAGDMIPADVRLLTAKDFFVSQAVLTGESTPVQKHDTLGDRVEKIAIAYHTRSRDPLDTPTVCFMGTTVISGTAKAVIVATGNQTYLGSLTQQVASKQTTTSFEQGVNQVTWLLLRFMAVMASIVFLINGLTQGDWKEAFLFAIAIAVGLTPEMLPLIVSANLARGAIVMAKHRVIIKRLSAIQNLGAMDVLCIDKTGTLTHNQIVLEGHLDVQGNESDEVLTYGYLNSYFQNGVKHPIDKAILANGELTLPIHLEQDYRKVDEVPFDFVRRRLSVVLEHGQYHLLICKGAVEEVLALCTTVRLGNQVLNFTKDLYQETLQIAHELNGQGLRTIAVAYKRLSPSQAHYSVKDEFSLTLVGYLTFLDPLKDDVAEAIVTLQNQGVAVKVITGDSEGVTRKICQDVGLDIQSICLGSAVENMSDAELAAVVEKTIVFAKMSPLHKARVVRLLQQRGHTVGYMGDGINDALTLRNADVGISVDSAVDVAKESADIILLEKSLLVLRYGILEGRRTFGNILKYLKMTASSNFGNVFSVLGASVLLPFLPMLPIHLLIQNLLYDLSQITIPFDDVDKEYLAKPQKWLVSDIQRFMLCLGPISSIFDYATFAVMWSVLGATTEATAPLFQSGWFVQGLLSQTLIIHVIRTAQFPFVESTAAVPVLLATFIVIAIGVLFPFTPLGETVGMVPLPMLYFPWLVIILVSYCLLTQLIKQGYLRQFGRWL